MAKTPDLERYRLVISIPDQRMALLDGVDVLQEYRISTALKGTSEALNSDGTPRGLHVIAEKIGAGQPIGMIFKGREPIGEISPLDPEGIPPVVTRLFRLRGLEASNQTSYERLIYLHGSPHEKLLGQPASGGCIRMKSEDVIALFDAIEVGTSLSINEESLPKAVATTLEHERQFAQLRNRTQSESATNQSDPSFAHRLCVGHIYGINGIPMNYPQAERWCQIAADRGGSSAMTLLAEMQEQGRLSDPDLTKARALYERAGALGHPHALAKAEWMQRKGIGGSQDLLAARASAARLVAHTNETKNTTNNDAAKTANTPSQ